MGDDREKPAEGRRNFLKTAGLATVAAAAVAPVTPAEAIESAPERTRSRYQETEHIRRFYALNRWVSGV